MYEEDYFMKLIQEFFQALDKAIHGKKSLDNPSDQENYEVFLLVSPLIRKGSGRKTNSSLK